MSLRARLLLALAPLFVLGLVAADIATYTSLQSFLVSRVDDQLATGHISVESYLEGGGFGDRGGFGGPGGQASSLPNGTWGELIATDGTVAAGPHVFSLDPSSGSSSALTTSPALPQSVTGGAVPASPEYMTAAGVGGVGRYRVYVEAAREGGTLVVAVPLDDVDSTLSRLVVLELVVTGGVTLVVLLATWLIVRRGLRPLERMGATARSIVASDLSRRVTPTGERTEVGRLGLALNTMLAQLEEAFAERTRNEMRLRHFVSDASHELRTPLTSMQGYAELLSRNPEMDRDDLLLAMRRMEEETRRMGLLVDDLLLLARLDQGRPLERRPVDLEALVTDACADARAADPSRTVGARIAAPLVVTGDEMRLRQVMGNVVRNALVHTPPGSPIEVSLSPDGADAVVEVVDHGPGIPVPERTRIFERFHRSDPGRSRDRGGSGLGLSIAAAVVAAHGGRLTVGDTPDGGATFRIVLPLEGPPPPAAEPVADGDVEGDRGPGEDALPANSEQTHGPL